MISQLEDMKQPPIILESFLFEIWVTGGQLVHYLLQYTLQITSQGADQTGIYTIMGNIKIALSNLEHMPGSQFEVRLCNACHYILSSS